MDFSLTQEQLLFQKSLREFAAKEIEPKAAHWDEDAVFPEEAIRKLAELGLMGLIVPEEYGGAGGSYVDYVIAVEEISRACASTGVTMSVNNSLVCVPILRFGTEEQKRKYLPKLASGEWLGAYCLTEPNAGSDAAALQTAAAREGQYYYLSGTKAFVTNGGHADLFIVYATTDRSLGAKGIICLLVERDFPGLKVGREEKKLGIRASSTVELALERCQVPVENRLGEEGGGFKVAMNTLEAGRIGIAGQALGIAQAAFEAARRYTKERQQFGKPISEFQAIQYTLADMATSIEAARLLTFRAAYLKDQGTPCPKESSMAKLFASEAAMWVATKAVQLHGGYGYIKEYLVERYFRDAKITEIYEGTSEIQRLVIARNILKGQ